MKQVKIIVSGKVQGVFFRRYTCEEATKLGLRGYVKNLINQDVEIVAQGDDTQIDQLIEWAKIGSPASEVKNIQLEVMPHYDQFADFVIRY
jgi:acylphosphatase